MTAPLPPLTALRAFEAAARHLSFKTAAEELHVTPAAVSQQVRALEEFVGQPLFHRLTRALELTAQGQAAAPLLQEAFDLIEQASQAMREVPNKRLLVVSVAPSFAVSWLVPRLDRFQERYPEIDLRIDASERLATFSKDGVDIGIRYGRGTYRNLLCTRIMEETVFPVCSPALLRGDHPIHKPEDLAYHTLIHADWNSMRNAAPSWRMWLKAMGVPHANADRGPRFSIDQLAVEAAAEGQGVTLAIATLVKSELASGRLVRPFPSLAEDASDFAYYLACPPAKLTDPKVRAFYDWVLEEATPHPDPATV